MSNINEGLCTPSKAPRPGSNSSPSTSTRSTNKRATRNAKITNFFTKVNSPSNNRNNSNSNHDQSENDHNQQDELSKDASSSSMKIPDSGVLEAKRRGQTNKDYVFIIPSSDDDTNVSTKGSQGRRRKPPSVHSNNSKSSDGLILMNNNNELAIGRKKKGPSSHIHNISEKAESNQSNPDLPNTPSSGRDSKSRDSLPEKRRRTESASTTHSTNHSGNNAPRTITRIQPTMISCRTKMIDFQSVPSDLNLPRAQALDLIEKLFLVKMPEDFFLFWDFAKTINHRKPCSAFCHPYLDWNLVGPYDVLSGLITDFHGFSKDNLARHCRFYYDPPEFQTVVMKRDSAMTHYGYYRDDPNQNNPIVVSNRAANGGQIVEMGDNLFALLRSELDASISLLSNSSQESASITFSSSSSRTPRGKHSTETSLKQSQLEKAKAKQELTIIRDKFIDFCSTHKNISSESWSKTSTRKSKCCASTLNTIGIVVPNVDETSFKGLDINDTELDTLLTEISESKDDDKAKCRSYERYTELRDGILKMNVESSRAPSLKLGLDLFFNGDSFFHTDIDLLLTNAYNPYENRDKKQNAFLEILKSHLEDRKRGPKVSLLEE